MNYYNANNETNINVKNNKGLDQVPDSPETELKRLLNPAMVVEDTEPKQTIEKWEDITQLLEKFQTIFSQNKYDVCCISLEPQMIHLTFSGRLADIKAKRNRSLKDGSGRCSGHAMLSPLNSF
ncbi:hypothetical protein TNCV_2234031 [Trichonephila clavipes]|nr:hypothetical protein TNCV_2234031 [Trichonephila clavipes]